MKQKDHYEEELKRCIETKVWNVKNRVEWIPKKGRIERRSENVVYQV